MFTDYMRDYNLTDLSPTQFARYAEIMRTNATEATNYNTRLRRHYKPDDCSSDSCMRERYCNAMNLDIYESD
jgi:hypothetical protein